MRHYRIKNRARFIGFLALACIVVCFVISGVFSRSSANEKRDMRYTEVVIEEGDTLWSLAKTYGSGDKDVREVVYDICIANDIKASDLRPGQVLRIPED